jgi:hypothetical protein
MPRYRRGESHGRAVLDWEKVAEIRSSELTERALAEVYKCHRSNIGCIRRGESWVRREEKGRPT